MNLGTPLSYDNSASASVRLELESVEDLYGKLRLVPCDAGGRWFAVEYVDPRCAA